MRTRGSILFAMLAVLLATSLAHAERRVALVLAADGYRSLRPLQNAVRDGRMIEEALGKLGFEVFSETNRDLRRMRRAMDDFSSDAAGADVALVFFAGHGVEIDGENRLLPIDADASSLARLKETSLPLEEITSEVAGVGKIGLVVLDACRNDPFGAAAGSSGRGAVSLDPDIRRDAKPGLGRVGKAENMLFAFSAAPGETASDGEGGNSPFTAALAKYIATDGLEIRSVMTLVQQEVYDATRGRQLPYVESGLPRLFFASAAAGALPERERLLMAMADVTPSMREEVEVVAKEHDMPLAPLYAALIASDATALDPAERGRKLAEAAESYLAVQRQIETMSAADPKVAALRAEAEASITLGAFDEARAALARAASIDSASRAALKSNFVERTLSEAATHRLSAGAARARLDYRLAIADLRRAVALYGEVERELLPRDDMNGYMDALEDLGDLSTTVGDIGAARSSYLSLRKLMERRVAAEAGDALQRRNLAIALTKLGNAEVARGDLGAALAVFEQAREILVALTDDPSPDAGWLSSRALAEDKISEVLVARGDLAGAARASMSALAIKRRLVERDPDPVALRDLTITYDALGNVLQRGGDLAAARDAYRASLDVREDLARRDPANPERLRDLWVSHDNIGDVERELENLAEAEAAYQAGAGQIRLLIDRDPQNRELLSDLAVTESKIGNVRRDQNDLDGAAEHYRSSLDLARELAASDPENNAWQRGLSVAIEKVADIDMKIGNREAALQGYEESLAIMRPLAGSDATNADWQRDLSITLGELGNLRLAAKDVNGAGEALSESLAIRRRLADSDPDNALWQRDLVIAHADFAQVADDPVAVLTEGLDLALALRESGRLSGRYGALVDLMRNRLEQARRHKRK